MPVRSHALSRSLFGAILAVPIAVSCSSPDDPGAGTGGTAGDVGGSATTGGVATGGASGTATTGGASGTGVTGGASGTGVTGGVSGTGVTGGAAGVAVTGGAAGAVVTGGNGGTGTSGTAGVGMGGAPGGMGGMGVAGSFVGGGQGGAPAYQLDCGGKGSVVEGHGPPANRANYVIIGDGYSAADLMPGGAFDQHIQAAMTKRFGDPVGQPFKRYRNFVNICGIKLTSSPICGSSLLGCCGDDQS